jgi:hypothetical protein
MYADTPILRQKIQKIMQMYKASGTLRVGEILDPTYSIFLHIRVMKITEKDDYVW